MKTDGITLKDRRQMNSNTMLLIITIILFIALYAAGCVAYSSKGFTNLQTFLNLFRTNAGLICVACGMTCVMLTGGIDISVGSLVALDCMVLAYGMSEWGMSAPVMIVLVLVIGVVFGLVQGFCVGYLEIQPFIVTRAASVSQATGMEMDAISSAVIGGTLLTGGVGNVIGSLFGVLINGTISTIVQTNGKLASSWPNILTAALLCFFIVLQSIFAKIKEKNR